MFARGVQEKTCGHNKRTNVEFHNCSITFSRVYRGFRIDGPASSWPRRHGKSKSSWPSKNGFGHNSAGLSPILMRICMVKDTYETQHLTKFGIMGTDF